MQENIKKQQDWDDDEEDESSSSKKWEQPEEEITTSKVALNEILRAIAGLSYAIALADDELQEQERKAFLQTIQTELGNIAWIAESRFELLEHNLKPNIDLVYNQTIYTIKRYRNELTPEIAAKCIKVVEKIAAAYGNKSQGEMFIIEKFKTDLRNIMIL
jgi:uncharacterized tellurite resistance protein B-like protein